jgi:hypothetical protein
MKERIWMFQLICFQLIISLMFIMQIWQEETKTLLLELDWNHVLLVTPREIQQHLAHNTTQDTV